VLKKDMPFTAKYMLEHYLSTGRSDDKVYGGVTTPKGIVFTELEDFSNDRA
jgi:8-oxo-dGTP diphosphatase